jgi:hypothetical protein
MKTKMNMMAVMAWAPAVDSEFCKIHTKGKASPTAVSTSVMAKTKTMSMANARGMFNMYAQNIVLGVTTLAFLTSSASRQS